VASDYADDFSYDPNQLDRDVVAPDQRRYAHGCANVAGGRMPEVTTTIRTFRLQSPVPPQGVPEPGTVPLALRGGVIHC
jgi:hypothetical protein